MSTLYLCGAGNSEGVRLALVVNRREARWDRIVLLDDDPATHGRRLLEVEVVGPFGLLAAAADHAEVVNLVARTTVRRAAAHRRIAAHGLPFATLVHPTVDLEGAELGAGVTVYQHATIGPEVAVGTGSVVFMAAAVGHGARLGAGSVVAPGGVINARVDVGAGVYVGSNAVVLPDLRVGAWATIAAGSVAMQDVPAGATVLGVPGRVLCLRPHDPSRPVDGTGVQAS
jgi:sugar O-acyltransferase (sialic acid O-acetyltransferase NeuD family)